MLRASLDEREEDDMYVEVDYVRLVMNEEIAARYGQSYAISLDEHGIPVVTAAS